MRILSTLKRHKWKTLAGAIVLFLILLAFYALSGPAEPEYVTSTAVRGDFVQTVEAVGTVISEKELALQFPRSGVVASVSVKEGDKVKAGARLAQVRSGTLAADVSSAVARLQAADADLRALMEGSRPEDIAIVEAEVENKRASLAAAQSTLKTAEQSLKDSEQKLKSLESEAQIGLVGSLGNARTSTLAQIAAAENTLGVIDDVFSDNDVLDAVIKDQPADYNLVRLQQGSVRTNLRAARSAAIAAQEYKDLLIAMEDARGGVSASTEIVIRSFDIVSNLQITGYLTQEEREEHKATISSQRTSIQSAQSALESALKTFRDASAGYETRIAAEESSLTTARGTRERALADITTYESTLRIGEAQLALKKAGARPTDIAAAEANVRQMRAAVARAAAELSDTLIVAPIDGTITAVAVKAGEFAPAGAAITMFGETPFRIEMFVSEVDIPRVQVTQSGSIELDAFRGQPFALHVSEVDTASTDKDGVSKYRVKLDFITPKENVKVGMTGDAEIITGMRSNVVSIPRRAVLDSGEGKRIVRVLTEEGTMEERAVTVGMEGGAGDVEIMTGVEEGETVIVLEKK
ncbi:MAG: efflux RND transporter periplasmic adaptor subunit [Candidatus Peregrinibacteria bacterium]|nr:efflux RND transporter periplasmic adaptor subunit [Candidatus Peregrinibacteria bacterium]